jgi:hypothetical protein
VASSASCGTKRPVDPSPKERAQRAPLSKKSFVGGLAGAYKSSLPSSLPVGTSTSADKQQLQAAAEMAAEKAKQVQVFTERAVQEAGEDEAASQSREAHLVPKVVDKVAEIRLAAAEEAKFNSLAFNLYIRPQDEVWMEKRTFFVEELKDPTKTLMDVFEKNFSKIQISYLMPVASDAGMILQIQEENAKEYKEALGRTGRFRGTPDNLATKLTMLHFGLPIEPVTLKNATRACEEGDETCPPDDLLEPPLVQLIMYAEKPLEFLDKYSEGRSHGYPMLRSKSQAPTQQNIATDKSRTQAKRSGTSCDPSHANSSPNTADFSLKQ